PIFGLTSSPTRRSSDLEVRTIVEFLTAAAAFVTIAAFLIPYVGLLEALLLDGVLVTIALVSLRLWTRSQPAQGESSTDRPIPGRDRKSTRLTSSHVSIS